MTLGTLIDARLDRQTARATELAVRDEYRSRSIIENCQHEWTRNGNNPTGPLKRCRKCKTSRRCYEKLPVLRRFADVDRRRPVNRGGQAV